MTAEASITRRLILSVLLIEFFAAVVLIVTVAVHERHVQFLAFEAVLRERSNALLGDIQEADSRDGSIVLDLQSFSPARDAIFRVTDSNGTVLGSHGPMPALTVESGNIAKARIDERSYRFYVLSGQRAIDPGKPYAVYHRISVVYGLPEGRVWHEIIEAVRFFAIATILFLGLTALILSWLIRRFLLPIRELAYEADKIDAENWSFHAPSGSKSLVELRPLASAIEKTILRLQRSFDQQRRFTSDAAHELKTDLAILKSSLQLILMKQRSVAEYEHGLSISLEDLRRLEATVMKMLMLARLEQGPKGEVQTVVLSEVLLEAITQSAPFAELRQVHMQHHDLRSEALAPLSREDGLLLCSNVLLNALQHAPVKSTVDITVSQNADIAILRIRDYGDGIAEGDKPFLFDAFYRSDVSRNRKTGGTGLGLSICRAICKRAGGNISIENHAEGGALVEIQLPIISSDGPAF